MKRFTSDEPWVPGDPCTFFKIVVMASGNGGNFQAIVDQLQRRILADGEGRPVRPAEAAGRARSRGSR